MEDAYHIKLMPKAEQQYLALRLRTRRVPVDLPSVPAPSTESPTEHLRRVNSILSSLQDPSQVYLDQSLLERMSWLLTRSIDSTLVYFLRIEALRRVSVLHITQFDSTNAYARFWAFMNEGGCQMLAALGVDIPVGYIGPSALLQ